MNRPRYRSYDNSKWDDLPLKITYGALRKMQERAYTAGFAMAEFCYRDREFLAPPVFDEWFDMESKRIGGYVNDSQELEVLGE